MYLKRSPLILFRILREQLHLLLKDKSEQEFIHDRLRLFDQHYCLEVELKLQQSYLDSGLQQHRWPVKGFLFLLRSHKIDVFYRINSVAEHKRMISTRAIDTFGLTSETSKNNWTIVNQY